nr:MAG TPA: hypothetical protein [Bacteriophage sp.]
MIYQYLTKHECRSFSPRHFPIHHLHFRIFL